MKNVGQFNLNIDTLTAEIRSNYSQFILMKLELFAPDVFISATFGSQFQMEKSLKIKLFQIYY